MDDARAASAARPGAAAVGDAGSGARGQGEGAPALIVSVTSFLAGYVVGILTTVALVWWATLER